MAKRMGRTSGLDGYTVPKWARKVKRESERAGWEWRTRGSGHVTVHAPDGTFVTMVSVTAYDGSLTRAWLSKLRRAGCPGA